MRTKRFDAATLALAAALACSGCVAPPASVRAGAPRIAGMLLETDSGAAEIALRPSADWPGREPEPDITAFPRGGASVEAAAHRALLDLRQGGHDASLRRAAPLSVEVLRREFERLRGHIAAAWQLDADLADATFMRVRLRATIAPDGTVRAIELIDSHGDSQEPLARFVADAIATLDGSSPLPLADAGAESRALVFRFEAGRARP